MRSQVFSGELSQSNEPLLAPDGSSIDHIAEELAKPTSADYDKLTVYAQRGELVLRDISFLTEAQREYVLRAGPDLSRGGIHGEYHERANDTLHAAMTVLHDQLQSYAGWNFLVNATGFLQAGLPWAKGFDDCFQRDLGVGIVEIVRQLGQPGRDADKSNAHMIVALITGNPKNIGVVGNYLAHRSEISQQFQERQYGRLLEPAKQRAAARIVTNARAYGLRSEYEERALRQLQFARLSTYDHLLGGVTVGDRGSLGDYMGMSLQIEVKMGGSPARATQAVNPEHIIQHELAHAASVQTDSGIVGLSLDDGTGLEPNEGMTEYQAQEALGFPGMSQNQAGTITINPDVPYQLYVAGMISLKLESPKKFATLHNAYYGQIDSVPAVKNALSSFYRKIR